MTTIRDQIKANERFFTQWASGMWPSTKAVERNSVRRSEEGLDRFFEQISKWVLKELGRDGLTEILNTTVEMLGECKLNNTWSDLCAVLMWHLRGSDTVTPA